MSKNKAFIKGILGEDRLSSGQLVWKAHTVAAYLGQEPWLMDATIKDNILFYRHYKQKRYLKVSHSTLNKNQGQMISIEIIWQVPNGRFSFYEKRASFHFVAQRWIAQQKAGRKEREQRKQKQNKDQASNGVLPR